MSTQKFIPILFSTPMVQAILKDRKTQTRRNKELDLYNNEPDSWNFDSLRFSNDPKIGLQACFEDKADGDLFGVKCPYGNIGDVLWVREKFCPTNSNEYLHHATNLPYFYQADVKDLETSKEVMEEYGWKWKPSIHMPKEACRIFLEITNIRVERLNDILEEDAIAEGIERLSGGTFWWKNYMMKPLVGTSSPIKSFKSLWESINGKESWDANPWVWVIEFKRIERPTNFLS